MRKLVESTLVSLDGVICSPGPLVSVRRRAQAIGQGGTRGGPLGDQQTGLTDAPLGSRNEETARFAGLLQAADGTRTHDLLHGKQWLNRGFPLYMRDQRRGDTRGLLAITVDLGNEWVIDSRRSAGSCQGRSDGCGPGGRGFKTRRSPLRQHRARPPVASTDRRR
jgi:hypothetical protein